VPAKTEIVDTGIGRLAEGVHLQGRGCLLLFVDVVDGNRLAQSAQGEVTNLGKPSDSRGSDSYALADENCHRAAEGPVNTAAIR
jgi:hypothetical protein